MRLRPRCPLHQPRVQSAPQVCPRGQESWRAQRTRRRTIGRSATHPRAPRQSIGATERSTYGRERGPAGQAAEVRTYRESCGRDRPPAPMTQTVTIDKVLSASFRGIIFNATTTSGNQWRLIADKHAMPRPPVPGEVWLIGGKIRNHPRFGRQVVVDTAELTKASGRLIVGLLQGPNFPNAGEKTAGALCDGFGEAASRILTTSAAPPDFQVLGSVHQG